MKSSKNKILNKVKAIKANLTVFFFEALYRSHIRIRYLHDKVYQRSGTYKKYSDSPVSSYVHRASMLAFIFSFIVFQFMQNIWPYMFTFKPREVTASQSAVSWTSYDDFNNNNGATGTTTKSQATINGSGTPTDATAGTVQLAATTVDTGSGVDGALTVNSGGTSTLAVTKTAVSTTSSAGQNILTVSATTGFAVNDKVLVIQMTGTGIGNQEEATVSAILASPARLQLSSNLTYTYTNDASSKPQVLRINQYTNVTVTNNTTWTVAAWDGTTGGILPIKATGTIQVDSGSKIDSTGKGFAGGQGPGKGGDGADGNNYGAGGGGGGYGGAGGAGGEGGYGNGGVAGSSYSSFLNLGSGGGAGGSGPNWVGGTGGTGGGAIKIEANTFTINGNIFSKGNDGADGGGGGDGGSGGGGSGGGIYLLSNMAVTNAGNVSAVGGSGGNYRGGGGGGGRIKIKNPSVTGTPLIAGGPAGVFGGGSGGATGVYPQSTPDYYSFGTVGGTTASNIGLRLDAGSGAKTKATSLTWNATTGVSGQKVLFKVRSGDTQAELDSSACYGPSTSEANPCSDWTTAGKFFSQINGQSNSSTSILNTIPAKRYIEVLARLESDGTNTPTLNDVTLTYDTIENPVLANTTIYKSDGTTQLSTNGTEGVWTNETSVKVTATGLTCTNCGTSTQRKIEVEVKPVATAFDGTATGGFLVQGDYSDTTFASTATISGLSVGTSYHSRLRTIDAQGRVSGWTSYGSGSDTPTAVADFGIEQTPPTGTVSINSGATYAASNLVALNLSASDTGGSALSEMRFSNDGSTWSSWEAYATTRANWDVTSGYGATAGDGSKTIYAQFRDNAGNVGAIAGDSWIQTTDAEFNIGTKIDVTVANDSVKLGPVPSNWIDGLASTPLEGKQVYNVDVSETKQWKTSNTSCVGPQCATGLDPNYPSNYALVADNTVNFSNYPARDACKTLGGRLPTAQELISIRANRTSYGNNYKMFGYSSYWTSTEYDTTKAWYLFSVDGIMYDNVEKTQSGTIMWVRCVRAAVPEYLSSGSLASSAITPSAGMISWGTLSYTKSDASNGGLTGTAITVDVLDGNGTPISGYTNLSSGASLSGLSVSTYPTIKLKANLSTSVSTNTPTLADWQVGNNIPATDSITLDMAPPAAFEVSTPANNTWQQSANPTLSWNASSDANGLAKYQLYVDGNLDTDNIGSGSTSQAVTNALSAGNHTWYIKAVDNAGNITQSTSTWNIGYDATNPSLALDPGFTFSATDTQISSVTISWNTYADDSGIGAPADYYNLERLKYSDYLLGSHTPTSNWTLGGDGAGSGYYGGYGNKTTTAQADAVGENPEDIEASVKYIYRVKVTDEAGNVSAWLKSDTGLTSDVGKPTNPSNVTAAVCDGTAPNCSDVANKGYEIKLAWTASNDTGTGVTGYKIYRRAEANSTTPGDFTIVGYLDVDPPGAPVSTVYYDNDTNNDATFTDTINDVAGTDIKNAASSRLNDYVDYYYRVVAIDAIGNQTDIVTLDAAPPYLPSDTNYATGKTLDVTSPSVPQNLVATAMGLDSSENAQRTDLSWDVSTDVRTAGRVPTGNGSGIAGYKVFQCQGDSTYCSNDGNYAQIGTTNNVSYTKEGLNEFTQYFYKVIAVDSASSSSIADVNNNNSQRSSSAGVTTASNTVPTVPLSVTVTTKTGNPNADASVGHQNTITFQGSFAKNCAANIRCVTGYEIYRSTSNYASSNQWLADAAKIAAVTISPVQEERAVTYTYIDNDAANNATSPSITRSVGGAPTVTKTQTATLLNATNYYYKVRAKDNTPGVPDGGPFNSGLSALASGTPHFGWDTTPDDTTPDAPQDVKVKDIHSNDSMVRNIVTWQMITDPERLNSSDFYSYEIWRYETDLGIGTATKLTTKSDRGDNYHVDGISISEKDKDYSYYVVAVDNAGTDFKYANGTIINSTSNVSAYLTPVSINPGAAKPTVASIQAVKVGVSSATITWTTNQSADSLVEYRVKDSSDVVAGGKDRTTPTTSHSVDIKALNKGTTYQYRIVSRNSLGNIDDAAATNWREFATLDFAISGITIDTTTTTASVKWTTNIDSDSNVEYKKEARIGETAEDSQTAGDPKLTKDHEVIIKALRPDTSYTYKIRSVTGDSYIAETAFLTFKTKPYDASQFTITPNASSIAEQNITATSAKIVWNTAVATTSWLDYGTSAGSYNQSAGDNKYNTVHVVELLNLTPGTTYFYKVRGKDTNDIEYTSQEYSFTAVLLPQILNPKTSDLTSYTITIGWETNVSATSFVAYGKDTAYGSGVGKTEPSKAHSTKLENLEDNTAYHYQITVKDQFGNEAKSADLAFTTPIDNAGPEVREVKIDILPMGTDDETASAIISWTTNKPATTQVDYDEGVLGGKYSLHSIEDKNLNGAHTVIIKDLNPSTTYHFKLVSRDKRGNKTDSQDYTFVTPTKEKSILQLIIRSLEETFSWVRDMPRFFKGLRGKITGR